MQNFDIFEMLGRTNRKLGWNIQEQRNRILLDASRLGWHSWCCKKFARLLKIVSNACP